MTESELTTEVIRLCGKYSALWHHCPDSRRCEGSTGFPDLVIAGPGGVIFAECKSDGGETTAEQDNWAFILTTTALYSKLQRLQHVYYLWRPQNLESGEIEQLIRLITLH